MKLFIDRDFFDNPKIPPVYLCNTSRKIIGELPVTDLQGDFKWNSYSEIQFVVNRVYIDVITGETIINPLFDKIESPRNVYLQNIGFFTIQDVDTTYGEKDEVQVSAFSIEYNAAQKYLNLFKINKGEEDSKEVIYASSYYPAETEIKDMYKLANANLYDSNEKYFHRTYTDSRHYDYEPIQIKDEADYKSHFGADMHPEDVLYIHGWAPVTFYDPNTPELSLLHLIFNELPEWKIGHVDYILRDKNRSFDEDRISIYDFIMQEVCDTFKCVCEWDTIEGVVNFYEEVEDGVNDDNTVATKYDTDIFISRDNLASEISVSYSADDIKTRLKVSGSDDLNIREVNLGRNYIMNLGYYHNLDWMEQDLFERYDDYLEEVEKYTPQYTEAMQKWVGANNKYNDFMNAVPVEGNVVLVGDPFKKLYCIYNPKINYAWLPHPFDTQVGSYQDKLYYTDNHDIPIDTNGLLDGDIFIREDIAWMIVFAYESSSKKFKLIHFVSRTEFDDVLKTLTESATESTIAALKEKLTLYHINEDLDANKTDNYLLRLKNSNSDVATIRIYNAKEDGTDEERKNDPDYKIQVVIVYAQSGTKSTPLTYEMHEWVNGKLTAEYMGLENYTVNYIGTMGAYFVLAKDEKQKATLEEYGVNLLKEKHNTYTTIFQTQTEAMFSQEKYQCIVQSEEPDGIFDAGTRWLDTDSSPAVLKEHDGTSWNVVSAEVSDTDKENYENYQRYIDNYEKMVAVQNVLLEKEKQAVYMQEGYTVSNRMININLYKKSSDGILRYNGQTLESDMHRVAEAHFVGHTIARVSINQDVPIYYFTTSYDTNTYAVYLKGTAPYVAYADSQGVHQATMDWITKQTDFENFFTEDQWIRLSPLIREDEFSDSNFLLTGYESEEDRLKICQELFESANKELNTLCQPSLEFSMDMANILALPEFKPLISQFQLGNFVRVHIQDGYVKRARLLEVHLSFSDLSDFSCNFGNLVTTKSEIDKHAELLSQAVTAGKQVATSAGDWQRAVDKSSKLEEEISGGLQNSAIQIGRASGQAISWDEHGFKCRKLVDGTTDQYLDEQIAIINNKIVFTNDGWKTSKAALGEFEVDVNGDGVNEKMYGLLADAVVSGYVKGSVIEGGSLKIGGTGGTFIVHEDGSVQILAADAKTPVYATQSDVDLINQASQYHIELLYDNSTIFGQPGQQCTLTCKLYKWDKDVTSKLPSGTVFSWLRNGTVYKTTTEPTLTVTNSDVDRNAIFSCSITFDETQIK